MQALKVGSVFVALAGLALLAYMVTQEGEPGLLPPVLLLAGAFGYFFARFRVRSRGK